MDLFIYKFVLVLFFIVLLFFILGLIKPTLVIKWGTSEKRNRKHVLIYYGISLIIILTMVSCGAIYLYGDDYTNYEKYDSVSYDTGITYEQLESTPDDDHLKKVRFTGKIIQVVDANRGQTQLRIAVNNDYNNILFIEYRKDRISGTLIKDNDITVSGRFVGVFTYTSTQNVSISIPGVWADNIELNS